MFDSPYHRVAVAIDGSPAADAAIHVAFSIVSAGGEVAFIHATDRASTIAHYMAARGCDIGALEAMQLFEHKIFENACSRAKALGFTSSSHAIDGFAGPAIVDYVRSWNVDAVVVGARSDHGVARTMRTSTAESVLRSAGVTTFVCPEPSFSNKPSIARIVVAVDDSEPSTKAIEYGIGLARSVGAEIQFASVQECDLLRRTRDQYVCTVACDQAARAGVPANAVVLHGSTAQAIIAAAQLCAADLIVVGTHSRIGRARLRYGSIAETVVRSAVCPVMVVPADNRAGLPEAVTSS